MTWLLFLLCLVGTEWKHWKLFVPVSRFGLDSTEALQEECLEESMCVYVYKLMLWTNGVGSDPDLVAVTAASLTLVSLWAWPCLTSYCFYLAGDLWSWSQWPHARPWPTQPETLWFPIASWPIFPDMLVTSVLFFSVTGPHLLWSSQVPFLEGLFGVLLHPPQDDVPHTFCFIWLWLLRCWWPCHPGRRTATAAHQMVGLSLCPCLCEWSQLSFCKL